MTTTIEPSLADRREAIYFKRAKGESLSIDEIGDISDVDKSETEAEVRRCAAVLKNQPLAATAADRETAKQQLADAEARLADESPRIAEAIGELQRQQQELSHAVETAAALVDAQARAVDQLRKNVPPHVAKYHQNALSLLNSQPQFHRMRELRTRAKQNNSACKIDIATAEGQEAAKRYANIHKPELLDVQEVGLNTKHYAVNEKRWAGYIAQLKAELPKLETDLADLQDEYAAGLAEIDQALNHYVPT